MKEIIKRDINILINANDFETARILTNKYSTLFYNDADFLSIKSELALKENEIDEAVKTIKSGLEIDNNHPDLLYNLAHALSATGNNIAALKYYKKAANYANNEMLNQKINHNIDLLLKKLYSIGDSYSQQDGFLVDKVLCVSERYYGYNPVWSYSAVNLSLTGTLVNSGIAKQIRTLYIDDTFIYGENEMAKMLIKECNDFKPDVLIFFVITITIKPLIEALKFIRESMNIKTIAWFTDLLTGLAIPERHISFKAYGEIADCMFDPCSAYSRPYYPHSNLVNAYGLVNQNIFYPMNTEKDIDVSFVGTLAADFYESRREYLEFLKLNLEKEGYHIFIGGGQMAYAGETPLAIDQYVEIINRSKIAINFSSTMGGMRNLKGRVFEIMACKTLLMEESWPDTTGLFLEGIDYVSFDSKEELLEKTLYYLKNEQKRRDIENSGWRKIQDLYNSNNTWNYVFSKIGYQSSLESSSESYKLYVKTMDRINNSNECVYPMIHSNEPIYTRLIGQHYELAEKMALTKIRANPIDSDAWYALAMALANQGYNKASALVAERVIYLEPFTNRIFPTYQGPGVLDEALKLSEISDVLNMEDLHVTSLMVTQNNEDTIDVCLSSIIPASNKIVIVDMGSTDQTLEIVAKYEKCNIVEDREADSNGAALTNGLKYCKGWVLIVRPHERLEQEDVHVIKHLASLLNKMDVTPCLNVLVDNYLDSMPDMDSSKMGTNRFFPLREGTLAIDASGNISYQNRPVINTTVRIRFYCTPIKAEIDNRLC